MSTAVCTGSPSQNPSHIPAQPLAETLAAMRTESGATLLDLTQASPVLLIFLRHFGCSFCRAAIANVADLRPMLNDRGVRPVFVHLGTPELAKHYFDYYHLETVERISNPDASFYQHPHFALARMHPIRHLFSPRVYYGWLKGALVKHGIGRIHDDGHQMPGIFFLKGPKIVRHFRYRTIADEPDLLKLCA
jgi:hypothetical protein